MNTENQKRHENSQDNGKEVLGNDEHSSEKKKKKKTNIIPQRTKRTKFWLLNSNETWLTCALKQLKIYKLYIWYKLNQ